MWLTIGLSNAAIAERLRVPWATVETWAKRAEHRRFVDQARQAAAARIYGSLLALAPQAIATLGLVLNSATASEDVKVRAATTIFRNIGIEHLASALDANANAIADSAKARLGGKVELMAERLKAIEATASETG